MKQKELRHRKMKLSKSEDEGDIEDDKKSPMIIFLENEEEEESLLSAAAQGNVDKDLLEMIAQVSPTDDNPAGLNDVKVYILMLCALFQACTLLLTMHLFSSPDSLVYEARHATWLADIVKILVGCVFEYFTTQGHLITSLRVFNFGRPKDAMLMLIPALLFEVQDWLSRIALSNLEPHPFRLFQEMRIIVTALVSMKILKTSYSFKQWICMILVWIGMYISTIDHALSKTFWNPESSNNFLGFETVILAVVCFSVGGIYFEHVLKVVPEEGEMSASLWMRVIQLSFFSAIIHGIRGGLVSEKGSSYFQGFTPLVWVLVFCEAFASLAVSASIFYADNVLKCIAIAAGASIASILYAISWESESSGHFFIFGCVILGLGVWFYCKPLPRACRCCR
mmetsp:Transcript_19685/g.37301  ORF Transcript_19685/g.37301 Transcript_19685/m.37301 type:complete len:395 (-) Transcript_19685:133-1317(-)